MSIIEKTPVPIKPEDNLAEDDPAPDPNVFWCSCCIGGEVTDPGDWYIATIDGKYHPFEIVADPLVEETQPQPVLDK